MIRSLAFAFALCASLVASDGTPFYDKVVAEQFSPTRAFLVEHYFERGGTDQIWLVSTADPAKRRLLFTHERHAEIIFSPDEKYLVINNQCLSNEARVLLYRQKAGLEYELAADLTDAAWQFFAHENGLKDPPGFDHSYVSALQWLGEKSPTILLSLDGHIDGRNHTSDWICLYEVATGKFDTDLKKMNTQNTSLEAAK
jgi:hypothetical protein